MGFVPDTKTFTNTVLDSSDLNSFIRDPIRFELNRPLAELRQTTLQTLANGTFTPILFDTEDTDLPSPGGHSTSSLTSRYVAQYPGWHQVSGGIGFVANAVGRRIAIWAVNGTMVPNSQVALSATAADETDIPARTKNVFLSAFDYVELHGYQESGGNLNTATGSGGSHMSVVWLRNA